MADKTLNIFVKLKDEVSKKTAGLKSKIGGLGKSFLNLKNIIVGGVVAIAFKKLFDAYSIQEEAETRLRSALLATGDASGELSKKLMEQASSLQGVTTFGDEAIISGQGLLANYGLQADEIEKLTPLVLDVAAATGKDLRMAFDMMGRATKGQMPLLKTLGFTVDETNMKMKGIQGVIAAMPKHMRGQAEALAKSGTGPMKQFGNMLGDVQEDIVRAFIPALNDIIAVLKDNMPLVQKIGVITGGVISIILSSVLMLGKTISSLISLTVKHIKTEIDAVIEIGKGAWQILQGDFKGGFKTISEGVKKGAKDSVSNFTDAFIKIGDSVSKHGMKIRKNISNIAEVAGITAKEQTKIVETETEKQTEKVGEELGKQTEKELEELEKRKEAEREAREEAIEEERARLEEEFEFRRELRELDLEDIIAKVEERLEIEKLSAEERQAAEQLLSDYKKRLWISEVAAVNKASDEIKGYTSSAIQDIMKGNKTMAEATESIWQGIRTMTFRVIADTIAEEIRAAVVVKGVEAVKGQAKAISAHAGIPFVGLLLGLAAAAAIASQIKGLKKGGIVEGDMIAHLGEGGKKEAVIPLESPQGKKLLGGMGGGISIGTIIFQFPNVASFEDFRQADPEEIKTVIEERFLPALTLLEEEGKVAEGTVKV